MYGVVFVHCTCAIEREESAANPQDNKSKTLNAVEIEEAISVLSEQPLDAQEFPFASLQAFGNKDTTVKRLRSGASNKSDLGSDLEPIQIVRGMTCFGFVVIVPCSRQRDDYRKF